MCHNLGLSNRVCTSPASHQSPLYLQTPPDNKKPKLKRDSRARRSSRYNTCSFCQFYFFSVSFYGIFSIFFANHRHRKQRVEVSLTVGSTETLRDVKLQVTIVNSLLLFVLNMLFLLTVPIYCQTDRWWEAGKSSTARPRNFVTKIKHNWISEKHSNFFLLRDVSCIVSLSVIVVCNPC